MESKAINKLIADKLSDIQALCDTHHVQSLYAFGSVCKDSFNEQSDIDLLVIFKPMDYGDYADNYFELADLFEKTFRRPVDLVTDKSLKNPYFIQSVNQSRILLYGS
jgi:predicted nucleotidyltransferase